MDILEELTKQAQLLRVKKSVDESWNNNNEALQSEAINALLKIHLYLRKIVNNLNQLRPEIKNSYDIFDKYQIIESMQADYEIALLSTAKMESLKLNFWMFNHDNKFVFKRKDVEDFNSKLSELLSYGLTSDDDVVKMGSEYSGIDEIEIRSDIPVSFIFTAVEYSKTINVVVNNFNSLGEVVYSLDSNSITSRYLNHLANYLIRKESNFFPDDSDEKNSIIKQVVINDSSLVDTKDDISRNISHSNKSLSTININKKIFLTYHEYLNEISHKSECFSVGREHDCNLIISSEFVSRYHASVFFRKGKFVIADKSTNGTFIKLQGGKEIYIQDEEYPITGCGLICLGKSISPSNEHLIYFFCE